MSVVTSYIIRVGDATSQWLNVVFLFSLNPNESISGRAYRLRKFFGWREAQKAIDFLFLPFEPEHCKAAYEADLKRAEDVLAKKGVLECDD